MIIRGRALFSDNFVESMNNYLQSESGTLKLQDQGWKLILLSFKFQNNFLIQLFHNFQPLGTPICPDLSVTYLDVPSKGMFLEDQVS